MNTVEWFTNLRDMEKLVAYTFFLIEEKYEMLSQINHLVDDDLRSAVPNMKYMLESELCKNMINEQEFKRC